jgi:hypothetical protein
LHKEFQLDQNISIFTVDLNDDEYIERLIVRLVELEDRIEEHVRVNNNFETIFFIFKMEENNNLTSSDHHDEIGINEDLSIFAVDKSDT